MNLTPSLATERSHLGGGVALATEGVCICISSLCLCGKKVLHWHLTGDYFCIFGGFSPHFCRISSGRYTGLSRRSCVNSAVCSPPSAEMAFGGGHTGTSRRFVTFQRRAPALPPSQNRTSAELRELPAGHFGGIITQCALSAAKTFSALNLGVLGDLAVQNAFVLTGD